MIDPLKATSETVLVFGVVKFNALIVASVTLAAQQQKQHGSVTDQCDMIQESRRLD